MNDDWQFHVRRAIRAEMGRRGKKFYELTTTLGYSYPTVSSRLNGHSSFTLDELGKVAGFLGITTADLLESASLGRRMDSGEPSTFRVEVPPVDPWEQPPGSRRRRSASSS